ncbi:MAG: hypothetical protein AAF108_04265 [Planctomycetota bacterium]
MTVHSTTTPALPASLIRPTDVGRPELSPASDATDFETQARRAAEKLVAQTLVMPVLRQIRESNEAAEPFAPSEGEKQFGALFDQRIADDLVRAAGFPLVDRLARDLLRDQVMEASAGGTPAPTALIGSPSGGAE